MSSRFVSHRASTSGQFDSGKDSHSAKFKRRPQILVKLSFRELFDSKLSGWHPFDNMIISLVKNRSKSERYILSSWDTNPWSFFCYTHWELTYLNKWHSGTSEILTPPKIAVGTHFHAQHSTRTTLVFLPADGKACWLLLPSSVCSLSSGGTVPLENTYSCILNVKGEVWESQERINI